MMRVTRSKLRRIRFLLYFFVPVAVALGCGALFDHWAQTTLRQAQETMSAEVDADAHSASDAADISRCWRLRRCRCFWPAAARTPRLRLVLPAQVRVGRRPRPRSGW